MTLLLDIIAYAIVAGTALALVRRSLAGPLSRWLLRQGRVKWAMRLRT
jgi:hypothetical protein